MPRKLAEQMRDPVAKRMMINLASSYERLTKRAAMREASETHRPADGQRRHDAV